MSTREAKNDPQPNTPINNGDEEIPQRSQICNGNDCKLSINNCSLSWFDDNGNFYCPSCSYNNAIAEVEKTQKDLILAKRNLQLARKSVFLFLNSPSVGSSEVVNAECVTECCGKGVDVGNCQGTIAENPPKATTADEFVEEKSQNCEGNEGSNHRKTTAENRPEAASDDEFVVESNKNSGGQGRILELEEESVSCQDKNVENENCRGNYSKTVAEDQPEVTTSDEFVVENYRICEGNSGREGSDLDLAESVMNVESENAEEQYGVNGDESERDGGGEGSNLELEESVSCQHKNVENKNADENYRVEGDESESMDDSQKSLVSDDSDDSVDGFDEDLDLLSQMFGQRASQVVDEDMEKFEHLRENEKDRESGVEFRYEGSNSGHRYAEKSDPFTDFRDGTPVVKKKLARRVTFSPVITVFPFEASQNDNEAMPCESARHSDINFKSETSNLQSPCAEKGDLFAEFAYDKSIVRSRKVASPELNIITEETARYYNGAKRHKLAKRSTNPAIPDSRRKRLHWTHEEEEKLVDCVRIFLNRGSRKLSWKSILDYGSQVFHRSRTPEDLRYKWKNLVKEASRGKRR